MKTYIEDAIFNTARLGVHGCVWMNCYTCTISFPNEKIFF